LIKPKVEADRGIDDSHQVQKSKQQIQSLQQQKQDLEMQHPKLQKKYKKLQKKHQKTCFFLKEIIEKVYFLSKDKGFGTYAS